MIENAKLLNVPVFVGLPEDQITWFISQSEELSLKGGDTPVSYTHLTLPTKRIV